jgi:hypothetical protein
MPTALQNSGTELGSPVVQCVHTWVALFDEMSEWLGYGHRHGAGHGG